MLVGKDTAMKVIANGHAIVQAVRPRVVISPLLLEVALRMHHHYSSKFLINILDLMGVFSSYSEV